VTHDGRRIPDALKQAHRIWFAEFHHWYDYEPEDEFDNPDEIDDRWRADSGNPDAGPAPFSVFARDGSGGLVAFWTREPGAAIETQPIVFLGSEGEIAVLARNLGDYLWLLAGGLAPLEPVFGLDRIPEPIPRLVTHAQRHTGLSARQAAAVTEAAHAELPALMALIESVSRHPA
jgi:hypothetical protein